MTKPAYGSAGFKDHSYSCGEVHPSAECVLPAAHWGPHTKHLPRVVSVGDAWPFPAVTNSRHEGRRDWFEITRERYDEFLGVLPPIYFRGGFFVSEPAAHEYHEGREVPVYAACVIVRGGCFIREVAQDRIEEALAELHRALTLGEGS